MPILHTIYVVAAQRLVGCITGSWVYGAAIACIFSITHEYTQAEYRWVKRFGDGYRHEVPWWGGFDPHTWDVASLMDFVVPVVAYVGLYGCMLISS